MHILVTGAAGFIGYHACIRFLSEGHSVVGIDSLNDYYSTQLKKDRLAILEDLEDFRFVQMDIADGLNLKKLFQKECFTHVLNLAAQAGVRYSLENPQSYLHSNLVGFGEILECCRHAHVQHLVYASSSSVYGLNTQMPYSTSQSVDHPVSLYAATKKSNELMAHSYSHLFKLPTTGLRFFTVYGPWGRPDMALFLFTQSILQGQPIRVFNNGLMERDFTYIDDIIGGVYGIMQHIPTSCDLLKNSVPDPAFSSAPYSIYNIGHNQPVSLMQFIKVLEDCLNMKAEINFLPMQPGDVPSTYADIEPLRNSIGFNPQTSLKEGISYFVEWYRNYYL